METVMNHGQLLYSLGQPWTTFTHSNHPLGRKRIHLRRRSRLHWAFQPPTRVFARDALKVAEEEDESEPQPEGAIKKFVKFPGTNKLNVTSQPPKDNKVVFVAGATGKVGSRTVRELLKLGFQVRASARNVEKAEALFQDVLENTTLEAQPEETNSFSLFSPAKLFAFLKPKPVKPQLDLVECDLEVVESIAPALGNAGVVVCCIGASEKEILDVTGPYRIDYKATENLINAASAAEVNHFVLLTSLGTQKFGFPAAVLNLFWGVLLWKAKAEKALLESGLPYTIIRPGGMERPTDSYKETHNLTLAEADKLFGGQVSNLQVAELIASIVENPDISRDKIVEVVAETTAPLRPIRELLEEIPTYGGQAVPISQSKKPRPTISRNRKEEIKRLNNVNEDEKLELKALRERYEVEIEAAKERENEAKAALAEKAELEDKAAEVRAKAEAAALAAKQAKALEAAILVAARKGNVLSDEEKQKILESVKIERQQNASSSKELKEESKNIFSFFKLPALGTETIADDGGSNDSQPSAIEAVEQAEKLAVAKIVEKKQEEETMKQDAEKLARLEAARALEAMKKEEVDKSEREARDLKEQNAKREEEEQNVADQKKKDEEAEKKATLTAEKAAEAAKVEKDDQTKKQSYAVLSPYIGFPGLKPPRPPTPSPPASKSEQVSEPKVIEQTEQKDESISPVKSTKEDKESTTGSIEDIEARKLLTQEIAVREEEALAKALEATSFVWPWQKPKPLEEEKEEVTPSPSPSPSPSENVTDILPSCSRPLSPYTQFPDLKPPSSPRASPPAKQELEKMVVEALPSSSSSTPLSPYAGFPGLKPPRAPTPSPPASKSEQVSEPKVIEQTEQTDESISPVKNTKEDKESITGSIEDIEARKLVIKEIAAREEEALAKALAANSFVWPWQKPKPLEEEKEELAPSPSPSPSPSENVTDILPSCSRPLSPYTQFPDLKPPSSPKASPPAKQELEKMVVEALPSSSSSTPLSPYAGFPDLKPPIPPTPSKCLSS